MHTSKYVTWSPHRTSGLNWVVFLAEMSEDGTPLNLGVIPSGMELGEYATYVEARRAHPDAQITPDAAEAIKYGNI